MPLLQAACFGVVATSEVHSYKPLVAMLGCLFTHVQRGTVCGRAQSCKTHCGLCIAPDVCVS